MHTSTHYEPNTWSAKNKARKIKNKKKAERKKVNMQEDMQGHDNTAQSC